MEITQSEDLKQQIVEIFWESKDIWAYLDALELVLDQPFSLMDLSQKDLMPDSRRNRTPEKYKNLKLVREVYVNGIQRAFISSEIDEEDPDQRKIESIIPWLDYASRFMEKMPSFLDLLSVNNRESFLKDVYELFFFQDNKYGISRTILDYQAQLPADARYVIISFRETKPVKRLRQLEYVLRYQYKRECDILLSHADTVVMLRRLTGSVFTADDLAELNHLIADFSVLACVSDSFSAPFKDYRARYHYHCNNQVLALLKAADYKRGKIVLFDNWRFVSLLHDAVKNADNYLEIGYDCPEYRYISSKIWKILKADEENGTECFSTLFYYLSANMSVNKTAELMHVHKNTVVYRLKKLKEEFHIDFSDIDECFTLMLSCRIYKYAQDIRR